MPNRITPLTQLALQRYPNQPRQPLQAFDAADEYLLHQLHQYGLPATSRVLILNDSFGALATHLAGQAQQIVSSGDSYLAYRALQGNLQRNAIAAPLQPTFQPANLPLQGPFSHVLIRIPKTLALLEEQLIQLQDQLAPEAMVLAGAMIKHLPRAAGKLLERYLGPVQASLAVKKARLLHVTPAPRPQSRSPYPSRYRLEHPPIELVNHANLFSRQGLDIGTRALLPHLPQEQVPLRIADLGCGNGVLGIVQALYNPAAQLTLVDESYMAIQSARSNWAAIHGQRPAIIEVADGLLAQPTNSLDRILCNPPFHQQQAVGDFLARRMFQQSWQALVPGGQLWLVGNRHLGYHAKLKHRFSQVEQVAATPKFIILKATKTP